MDEVLLTQIVKRVLAELNLTSLNGESGIKKRLLILSDKPERLEEKMDWILSEYAHEYELYGLKKEGHFQSNCIKNVEEGEVKHYKWDKVFLAFCSVNTLVKIALGLRDGSSADLIGIALSKGTPVEIEPPSFGFTTKTHGSYMQLMKGYLSQVSGYGVVFRDAEKLVSEIKPSVEQIIHDDLSSFSNTLLKSSDCPTPITTPTLEVSHYEKRLLTERDVNKIPEKTILLVKKETIITPLAKDALKLRNIKVQSEGEG